jgi:hypothetical protein
MRVVSVVSGIFFKAKIELAVRRHGTNTFCNSVDEVNEANPELIIVDLEHLQAHEVLRHFGKKCVAFGPHLRTDLLAVAREFGARTFPRSVFFNELEHILRSH